MIRNAKDDVVSVAEDFQCHGGVHGVRFGNGAERGVEEDVVRDVEGGRGWGELRLEARTLKATRRTSRWVFCDVIWRIRFW